MIMRFLLTGVVIAALTPCATSWAQTAVQTDLQAVAGDDSAFFFVSDARKESDQATAWVWQVFLEPDASSGVIVDAVAALYRFDCPARRLQRERTEGYRGTKFMLGSSEPGPVLPAAPGTVGHFLVDAACEGRVRDGFERFSDLSTALEASRL